MPTESSGFNPNERLPMGYKVPDTPEMKAAIAANEKMLRDNETRRQQEKEAGNVRIFSKEESAQIRAEADRRLAEQRKIIEGMN